MFDGGPGSRDPSWDLVDYQQISGFRIMLRNLLAERFKMQVHHETKEFPVYELMVGKNGARLKESREGDPPIDKEGFPQLPAGKPGIASVFVRMLHLDRVILDKTGLVGKYDFTLRYSLDDTTPGNDPAASVFTAVQEQLGLKLVAKKGPFDVVVVDHAEKTPVEN